MLPGGIEVLLADRFGGRRGFVRYCIGQAAWYCGGYRRCKRIDWPRVERLVFICAGNICRSPLAEYVAGGMGFKAASFGLQCTTGAAADPRARAFAALNGLDLSAHRATSIDDFDFGGGDLLIGMEPAHLKLLPPRLQTCQQTLLGVWDEKPFVHLQDPYTTTATYFEACERAVVRCTRAMCEVAVAAPAASTAEADPYA